MPLLKQNFWISFRDKKCELYCLEASKNVKSIACDGQQDRPVFKCKGVCHDGIANATANVLIAGCKNETQKIVIDIGFYYEDIY